MTDSNELDDGDRESPYEKPRKKTPRRSGRPQRASVISNGEIIDLLIDLHTTTDVNEFLKKRGNGNGKE